jgi:hypothetical protein
MWESQSLITLRASTACTGIPLPLPLPLPLLLLFSDVTRCSLFKVNILFQNPFALGHVFFFFFFCSLNLYCRIIDRKQDYKNKVNRPLRGMYYSNLYDRRVDRGSKRLLLDAFLELHDVKYQKRASSQLPVVQLHNFPTWYETGRFIIVLTTARHCSLSLARRIQATSPHLISLRFI